MIHTINLGYLINDVESALTDNFTYIGNCRNACQLKVTIINTYLPVLVLSLI